MRIGIISEGHSDRAVITSILLGATSLDDSDIRSIRPLYKMDATDLAAVGDDITFSTWSLVKKECEEKELIRLFLSIEGQDFVIIHIDTAEAELYNIKRPNKRVGSYCFDLRKLVIDEIKNWLKGEFSDNVLYAIAIEETEAWLLTIYSDLKDTTSPVKPKERLHRELGKKGIDSTVNGPNFKKLSKPFYKLNGDAIKKLLSRNCSLGEFYDEVKQKLKEY